MKELIYDEHSIQKMDAITHIREKSSMYIGSVEDPTHILIETLDNSCDETQSGFCDTIIVNINNKEGIFSVTDNGRGLPFNKKLPLMEDPPILICTNIYTSGKFKKGKDNDAYSLSIGTHGIGLTATYALSEFINFEIYRNKERAIYSLHHDGKITRNIDKFKGEKPFSTKVEFKPSKKYFDSCEVNVLKIRDRLLIASANFENLNITLIVDGKKEEIKYTEHQLIEENLSKNVDPWFKFNLEYKRTEEGIKCIETSRIVLGWDLDSDVVKQKFFTSVNLVPISDGGHLVKVNNIIKNIFQKYAKKENKEFDESDSLNWLRLYIDLKLINPSFDSQTKNRLAKSNKLEVLEEFEKQFEKAFKQHYEYFVTLMVKFEEYRRAIQNKKVLITSKRASNKFTKLIDCLSPTDGELFIVEGDSAVGGLQKMRDVNIHAFLPLKGKPMNAGENNIKQIMDNVEMSEIITSVGTGIAPHCNIDKIRYSKIILTADADPDGNHINVLLLSLFMKHMPDIIKNGYLYLCEPPLYGYGYDEKFVPLWTEEELEKARKDKKHILRFKGLGEYSNILIERFILKTKERRLLQLQWYDDIEKLISLVSDGVERKKLALGEWTL